jgi:predicted MPP superfamily phosphohydrolase
MKRSTARKAILILSVLILLTSTVLYYGFLAQKRFRIKYLAVSGAPESFSGVSVLFLSDLEYGTFFDAGRLAKLSGKLSDLQVDVVVFGGDLFDAAYSPVMDDVEALTAFLGSIDAPLGKFAILGDSDQLSEQRAALVRKVLYDADFELLQDNPITLHNGTGATIGLVGIDYDETASDLSAAFSGTAAEGFVLTVVHGAGLAQYFPAAASDLTLAGHSHHCQINLPFARAYDDWALTGNVGLGKQNVAGTPVYVAHGLGTTGQDLRIFDDPQILIIRF